MKTAFFVFSLICLSVFAQQPNGDQGWEVPENPFHQSEKYGGLNMRPSLKVRVAQGVSEMFRDNLANYGRSYLNSDFKLKTHGDWGINWNPIVFYFEYMNLRHTPIQIDMSNFTFNYTTMKTDNTPVIFM